MQQAWKTKFEGALFGIHNCKKLRGKRFENDLKRSFLIGGQNCTSDLMWNLKFESWKFTSNWTLDNLTLISFINDWFMARAIRAKCFVKCSTTTIAKIIETFKWVQVVITDAISYQICNSSTLVTVKSGMFKSWQEVPIELHVSTLTPPVHMDKACISSIFIKASQFVFAKTDIDCRLKN